jgi:hypothetical protein
MSESRTVARRPRPQAAICLKPIRLSFVAALCIWVAGCGSDKPSGHIYLDHGEVFTRQRLLNDRLNNLNWLYMELEPVLNFS